MLNTNTSQNKTIQNNGSFERKYHVDTPKLYTMKKAALFGMFSIFSILLLNIPIMQGNAYADETDGFEKDTGLSESSLIRNHFVTGSPVHPNLVIDEGTHSSLPLEERTDLKKHFSYGKIVSDPSYNASWLDNFHEERR